MVFKKQSNIHIRHQIVSVVFIKIIVAHKSCNNVPGRF
jgi:hypothetical protein